MNAKEESRLKQAHAQLQRAKLLGRQNRLSEAMAVCEALVREFPTYTAALRTMASVCTQQGNHPAALANLVRAELIDPEDIETLLALSDAYVRLESPRKAHLVLERARRINPHDAAVAEKAGQVLQELGDLDAACAAFRDALRLEAAGGNSACELARCQVALGQYKEAAQSIGPLLESEEISLNAIEIAALLPVGYLGKEALEKAYAHLSYNQTEAQTQPEFRPFFARAQLLDRLGRHEEAWRALVEANQTIFPLLAERRQRQSQIRTRALAELKKSRPFREAEKTKGPGTLFVTGPSRSGKTVLETLISSVPGVLRGHETLPHYDALACCLHRAGYPLLRLGFEALPETLYPSFRKLYMDSLVRRLGENKLLTITHPGVIDDVAHVSALTPNAKFIFVKRNPADVAFRIYASLYREGNSYAYSLQTIHEYLSWCNEMIDVAHAKAPAISVVVRYEDVVADPQGALGMISDALKLGLVIPDELPETGDDRDCAAPYRSLMAFSQ